MPGRRPWRCIYSLLYHSLAVSLMYSLSQAVSIKVTVDSPHAISKRERAFDLARLQSEMDHEEDRRQRSLLNRLGDSFRDEAINDKLCQDRCNQHLKSGLDMVKAHMAFGSIGVPAVVDSTDLALYCRLDAQHDQCLKDCGFTVQFNMRDYVCKRHYDEMNSLLRCFAYASPLLKIQCGVQQCGPYGDKETTVIGYAHRCRMLLCDMACTRSVLLKRCGPREGLRAIKFLSGYTREQVLFWMQDLSEQFNRKRADVTPYSCRRLICDPTDTKNCTING